jgi:putative nucleotidyltransferase with HDIG domain
MDILRKAEEFARGEYQKNDPRHQWSHVQAVMERALEIARHLDGVDHEALKLAVLFHDIDYHSEPSYRENYENHVENSIQVAEKFLKENNLPEERINKIKQIMLEHSTPHRRKIGDARLLEGKIIYDADKSLSIKDRATFDKYFDMLYFDITKEIVKNTTRITG